MIKTYNKYASENNLPYIYKMEDFNDVVSGLEPLQVVNSVCADFDTFHSYFTHTGLNFVSYDSEQVKRAIEYELVDFAEWYAHEVPVRCEQPPHFRNFNRGLVELIEDYIHDYCLLDMLINKCEIYYWENDQDRLYYVV